MAARVGWMHGWLVAPLRSASDPHLFFPRATLDSQGSSACQGQMESG
jgi:hypothetical protein